MFSWPGPDEQFPGDQSAPGLRIAGKRSQTASLLSKLKQTVIYTSRFKMRLAINRESSLSKYQQNRNGVQFVKRFSVGRGHDSLCTFNLRENSRSTDKSVRMPTREASLPT